MKLFDGPWKATEKDCNLPWSGGKNGEYFRCYLCGYKFKVGDRVRCQYTNDIKGAGGNPLVCETCDTSKEDVIEEWKKMNENIKDKYWAFSKKY